MSVNGVNVENVEHSFVIRLLKEAKDFIHLVVKRKLAATITTPNTNSNKLEEIDTASKRHNLAIQQTAATVVANFTQNINNNNNNNETDEKQNGKDLMSQMMQNGTTSMSSLKPFKVTLSKKDKKDTFGIVLGCKYYIKDILPNSVASNETNLRKGDLLLKLNDLSHDQFSLFTARKILQKTKESKVHLVIKRNSVGSSLSSVSEDEDSDLIIDETPIHVSVGSNLQHPVMPPPPPPPPPTQSSSSSLSLHQKNSSKSPMSSNQARSKIPPEVPPRPNAPATTTPKKELILTNTNNNGMTTVVDSGSNTNSSAHSNSNSSQPQSQSSSLFKQLFKPIRTNGQGDSSANNTNSNNRLSKFYSK